MTVRRYFDRTPGAEGATEGDVTRIINNYVIDGGGTVDTGALIESVLGVVRGEQGNPAVQIIDAAVGVNTLSLTDGTRIHAVSTAGSWSLYFTDVPAGGVEVLVSVDVSVDGHELTIPGAKWHGTAPVAADWDAGETNVIRLTKPPFVDSWIAEWVFNDSTPDPDPVITPPTLTAQYSTSSARTSPSNLGGATLPAGEVAVFFGPVSTDIESFRIFCNHSGALPAKGAEGDSFVKTETSAPYDLLGGTTTVAVMWNTAVDPTGNARTSFNPNGSNTITIEATLIDGQTVESTFTFSTSNAPIGATPTITHSQAAYASALSTMSVTIPDGVDRVVVVQAHYRAAPFTGSTMILDSMSLGGTAMTEIAAATKDIAQNEGAGCFTAYLTEASLDTGTFTLSPTYASTPNAGSSIIYHVWVLTNVASPVLGGIFDYDNISPTTTGTSAPSIASVPANSFLLTSVSQRATGLSEPAITGWGSPTTTLEITDVHESRAAWITDSGVSATETATWDITGRSTGVLVYLDYAASGGGGGVTPIIPGTPTVTVSNAGGDNRLTATWSATTNAVSYEIRWGTTNPPAGIVSAATSPHVITGLAASTLYYVQVRAVSSTGDRSAWSTAVSGTPSGSVTPPPTFSDKFLVSFDHRDVMMGEGYGTPNFRDLWSQKGFFRVNPANNDWDLANIVRDSTLDSAIGAWEGRNNPFPGAARPFRNECGPRLIVTGKLSILGTPPGWNSTGTLDTVLDMARSGSTGTVNRDATWVTLGNNINRTYRGWNVWDIVFYSVSHELNGPWSRGFWGTIPSIVGASALTQASSAQYGSEMAAAMRRAGATGQCDDIHRLACEHVMDILTDRTQGKAILGMTPSDGGSSALDGNFEPALGTAWIKRAFPGQGPTATGHKVDFLCPTMYSRGANNVVYDGSGSIDSYTNYVRSRGWLEYADEYVNDIYGCAFGLLEFGGDFAIPGERTVGQDPSNFDEDMVAFMTRMLEVEMTSTRFPNGFAFINWWWFLNWVGSDADPGCSFNIFEGIWGRFPTNATPNQLMSTALSKPTFSTQTSNTRYPKSLEWMRSRFSVA